MNLMNNYFDIMINTHTHELLCESDLNLHIVQGEQIGKLKGYSVIPTTSFYDKISLFPKFQLI